MIDLGSWGGVLSLGFSKVWDSGFRVEGLKV